MTYSYADGDLYHFMDNETYDDIPVNAADVPDNFKFCKENEVCKLLSYKGKVFSVEIPNFIELEITETEPGFKGNTATNTLKPPRSRPAPRSACPCSSTRATRSASTPAPASIWSASDRAPRLSLLQKGGEPLWLWT